MMSPSLRAVCWLWLCVGALSAQSFDELLGQAETKLRAKDAAGALPLLDAAMAQDGKRWDGHYVKAVALLSLGRAGEAVSAAEGAMALAPAEHKVVVERLLARARAMAAPPTTGQVTEMLREAEAAQREGMRALAAKKFAAAFAADPGQARAGLKAAALYFLLEEHGEASRLLRRLRETSDEAVRQEAVQMLEQLRAAVSTDLARRLGDAQKAVAANDLVAAATALDAVDALWAQEPEALLLRCKLAVRQQQPVAALDHLRAAVAAGFDRVDALRADPDLVVLVADEPARLWMEQAFGSKLVLALQSLTVAAAPAVVVPVETPTAPPGQLATGIGLVMVAVGPATDFVIGSPVDEVGRDADEAARPAPILKSFWLAQSEVTQRQWQAVMGSSPWTGQGNVQVGDDVAATFVSWGDAQEFCRRLTEQERVAGRLPDGCAYRLPREAEWEYACRGGAAAAFCFGNDAAQLGDYAVFQGSQSGPHAHRVKLRKPNAFGLHDLHGNVAEWCEDAEGNGMRVLRGGSWRDPAQYCRSANRLRYQPDSRYNDLGFRPALAFVDVR
ncbi:MAG: SUMF1/EgtB/PvdO family nonheme iron enzyme [Planctomycetes bacterium]|jgi:formylglycine-generating enzyme required for sulfatase activity|nr:SUMF1/EgtB/PvdO family nonheme iron enzyme [Planctomycetota bacterium]